MNLVCINGEFVPSTEAKVSVWDHGFLYGDGLFETMRAYGGKIFALAQHLTRLRHGAQRLRLEIAYTDSELSRLLDETIRRNNLQEAYIRLTYSRGEGPIGLDPALCSKGNLVIMVKAPQTGEKVYREGIRLGICPIRRNPSVALPPEIKSMNFLNNILAKIWAKEAGYDEALLLNDEEWITETTVSNIFFVKAGKLFTPALEAGILPGVTRDVVIAAAEDLGIVVKQGYYSRLDLIAADEIFLTNSGSEVIPVTSLNGQTVGKGIPGEITQHLHQAFKHVVQTWLDSIHKFPE